MRSASRYEPDVNPTYQELAVHYETTVLPTRPHAPQDKAKVEAGVQAVEREVMAPLRDETFTSLAEARQGYAPLVERLNARPFQKLEGSRRGLFEELDRPNLKPLPASRYEVAQWQKRRVHIDYHVHVDGHYYSVPHTLAREEVEVRLTARTLEVFHQGRRVASHPRSHRKGRYTTRPEHMPAHHRGHLEWSPERFVRWASTVGPETASFAEELLERRAHPEQAYRACLGLMELAKSYPTERMEAACRRARLINAANYRSVKSILENHLDQRPVQTDFTISLPADHAHVRGADYYHTNGQGG